MAQLGRALQSLGRFLWTGNVPKGGGLVHRNSLKFVNGLALSQSRPRIVLPLLISFIFEVLMFLSCLTDNVIHYADVNWFMKLIDYTYSGDTVVFIYTMMRYNREIAELSEEIDRWWVYSRLDEESDRIKRKTVLWLSKFDSYYYYFMGVGTLAYILMPIGKFIYNGHSNIFDLLLYYSWTPFSLHNIFGFIAFYIFNLITIYISFFAFSSVSSFMLTAAAAIGFQIQLIGEAISTMQARVLAAMEEAGQDVDGRWGRMYEALMQQEIKSCVMNYQHLCRLTKKLFRVFSLIPTLCYYSGMCLLVFSSVKILTNAVDNYSRIQAISMVCAVLLNQYLYSLMSESLTEAVAELRFTVYSSNWYEMPLSCQKSLNILQMMMLRVPTPTTLFGAKTNFEFFTKVINTSYYYICIALTMNNRILEEKYYK